MLKPNKLANNNFLSSLDLSTDEVLHILDLANNFKNKKLNIDLGNKVLGLIFDKSSTRTRVSFQVAMTRLGGTTIDLNPTTSQIGRGEPIKDTARVLSRYCDVIAIRTFDHSDLEEYAKWSTKPVINALTDLEHPCQALADFMTIKEEFLDFKDVVLTFIGDGNNVANSLILCGALLGVEVRIACPKGYEPNSLLIDKAYEIYKNKNLLKITNDPNTAVLGANVLYTDVWSSMGEENQKEEKDKYLPSFFISQILDVVTLEKLKFSKADIAKTKLLRKWHLFLKNKNIAQLDEFDRFKLHQELEMFLPSFIFYLPQNSQLDWLHKWRDNDDKLFHPSNLVNGDLIKKNLEIKDGPILGELLQYLSQELAYKRLNNFDEAIYKAKQWIEQNAPKCD